MAAGLVARKRLSRDEAARAPGHSRVTRTRQSPGFPGAVQLGGHPGVFERDGAHDVLEQAHGREVLGGAPGDEPGAASAAPEDERQGLEPERGQAREEGKRKPGEPRPLGEEEQALGAGAQHRPGALAGALAQPLEDRGERGPAPVGAGARGGVALEPGVAQEVAGGGPGAVEGVAAVRDDAGGDPQQRLAAQERGQRPPRSFRCRRSAGRPRRRRAGARPRRRRRFAA